MSGTVLWLLPDINRESFFRKTIRECSAVFKSPVFDPHVTLGRIPDKKTGSASKFIEQIASSFSSFSMVTRDLECRDEPYQKLVIPLSPEKNYHSLCDTVDQYFGGEHSKRTDPHISLLYSYIGCDTIKHNRETLGSNFPKTVEIREIAIVDLRGQPDKWKILQRNVFRALT